MDYGRASCSIIAPSHSGVIVDVVNAQPQVKNKDGISLEIQAIRIDAFGRPAALAVNRIDGSFPVGSSNGMRILNACF